MKDTDRRTTKITIINLTRRRIPRARSIERVIKRVLFLEKKSGLGLNVIYVNDRRIRELNRKYRKKDLPTDVLAFSAREGGRIKGEGRFLGEIIISIDAAKRQAKCFDSARDRELKLYLIHGILHLLGYEDETEKGLAKMRRREKELFLRLK